MAEGEGFEPPDPFGSVVFKTTALNHSATPPRTLLWYVPRALSPRRLADAVIHQSGVQAGYMNGK